MKKILFAIAVLCAVPSLRVNASTTDYLILNNIGSYEINQSQVVFPNEPAVGGPQMTDGPGILSGVDHFFDHDDKTYQVRYIGVNRNPSPKVQVTQHAGADSDKWLLHEVEDAYRSNTDERMGLISQGTRIREINGNKIIGMRGSGYTWVCNNVIIDVSYTDLQGNKPEPLEIIQAYLAKYPSRITVAPAEFKSAAYNVQWIKDEMERRLWLCDKWSMQLQLGKVSQRDMLEALVKHMKVFLNYRQKYYGVKATDDITAISTALQANDGTTIKSKLAEYKSWWNANKGKSISI